MAASVADRRSLFSNKALMTCLTSPAVISADNGPSVHRSEISCRRAPNRNLLQHRKVVTDFLHDSSIIFNHFPWTRCVLWRLICTETFFGPGQSQDPAGRAYDGPSKSPSRLGRGTPLPILLTLHSFGLSIWAPSALRFFPPNTNSLINIIII